MFRNHLQAIVPRVFAVVGWPAMDDDRQFRGFRQLHLLPKHCFLHLAWRVVVKIVEADFPPGNYRGIPRPSQHLRVRSLRSEMGFMRMSSDARPDSRIFRFAIVLLRQLNTTVGALRTVAIA